MRGIRFVQVPTTLLAQVDASVGGKTAVNHPIGKNLIGAFHQPAAVIIDTGTLQTLQDQEFNAGLAEVVKYGAIRDPEFFAWLEDEVQGICARNAETLDSLIYQSIRNKAEIVSADEKELGIRALLNFGHSFGHALEAVTHYSRYLHGEAVSIGMVIAARLSVMRDLTTAETLNRLASLLREFNLPTELPESVSVAEITESLELDKKALASGLRLILLRSVGDALIDSSSQLSDIMSALEQSQPGRP
jgi:3-dehydroquinate synthase